MQHISLKRIISTWVIFSFFALIAQAQTDPAGFLQKNTAADLVIEGEVISQLSEYSIDKSTILTKSTLRIFKIFQGELREGFCEIITPGGITDDRFLIYGKSLQLSTGDKGLFWVKKGKIPFDSQRGTRSNEYWAMEQSDFLPRGTKYSDEQKGEESLDLFGEVLRLLGKPSFEFPENATPAQPESVDCSDPNFENWAQISLENIQISGNFSALECDVVLKAYPEGIKFGKGQVAFTLPKAIFGTDAVSNQNLIVQKGAIIANNNYTISYNNLTDSTISVQVNQLNGAGFSYDLSGTYETFLHIKADIANPLQLLDLKPEAFGFSGQLEYLCSGRYLPFKRTDFVTPKVDVLPNFENPIGLHYTLDRFYLSGFSLTADVLASTDALSSYKSGKIYIDYDDATSGSNISASINQVAGALTNNPAYTVGIFDEDANTLRIEFLANGSSALVQLGTAPVLLLRIQIPLFDCNKNLGIKWNNLTLGPNHTYIEGGTEFQYMPVSASGDFLNKICACNEPSSPDNPVIASLSSTSVKAGVGEILTITGNKFGNGFVEGECYIEVNNADHSPANKTKIPYVDIISWTNTEIKFYVPSTTIGQTQAPMESGPVKVVNYCGSSNTKEVEVEYAVLNYRSQLAKPAREVGLAMNTPSEIQFEYYTDDMDEDAITMIEEGLEAWRCVHTEIKWKTTVAGTNYSTHDFLDKRNIIKAVPANQVPTAYAGVLTGGGYIKNCASVNGLSYFVDDIDIIINKSINWDAFPPSNHPRILRHDLGHAHLLQHASYLSGSEEKIVHYSYAVFQSIRPEDRAGGLHVLAAAPVILNGCSNVDVIEQMDCTNAVEDNLLTLELKVMPNPFGNGFSLTGNEDLLSNPIPYKILDVFGSEIVAGSLGLNTPIMHLSDKPSGIYFICILVEDKTLVFKAVKQ